MSEQIDRPVGEVPPIPTMPQRADRRNMRAIDDAWEAVVRQELARIRRSHQRNSRFSRPERPA